MRFVILAALMGVCAVAPAYAQRSQAYRQPPSPEEILKRADEVRFPQEGVEAVVEIQSLEDGHPTESRTYKVLSKGNDRTVILTVAPASERGQMMLMHGRDLWAFLPRVSQPVRISLAQRLVGQVANGDIARANFTGDYVPRLAGTQRIGNENFYVLDLFAADRKVTYKRVRYWVRQTDYRPYMAEFYSVSNRLLKTCRYDDFRMLGGKVRPARLVLTDALTKGTQSTLVYSAMKPRDLPDRIFSKEYLRQLD